MLDLEEASVMILNIIFNSYQFVSQISIHFKDLVGSNFGRLLLSLVIVDEQDLASRP
jgi:hypothetical protein